VIEAQTEGRARAVEAVTASFHGDQPAIAFNPHYLLDGLVAAGAADAAAPRGGGAPREGTAREVAGERTPGEVPGERTAGGVAEEGQAGGAAADTQARVRLEFTSPAKPALITPSPPAADTNPPTFRYLVVPLRPPARS
jgi:hypothetical protein